MHPQVLLIELFLGAAAGTAGTVLASDETGWPSARLARRLVIATGSQALVAAYMAFDSRGGQGVAFWPVSAGMVTTVTAALLYAAWSTRCDRKVLPSTLRIAVAATACLLVFAFVTFAISWL